MKCLVCERPTLEGVGQQGLFAEIHGNDGSRVFDLSDGFLRFALCDKCAIEKAEFLEHVLVAEEKTCVEKTVPFKEWLQSHYMEERG